MDDLINEDDITKIEAILEHVSETNRLYYELSESAKSNNVLRYSILHLNSAAANFRRYLERERNKEKEEHD
jgi:hypothetical protein